MGTQENSYLITGLGFRSVSRLPPADEEAPRVTCADAQVEAEKGGAGGVPPGG